MCSLLNGVSRGHGSIILLLYIYFEHTYILNIDLFIYDECLIRYRTKYDYKDRKETFLHFLLDNSCLSSLYTFQIWVTFKTGVMLNFLFDMTPILPVIRKTVHTESREFRGTHMNLHFAHDNASAHDKLMHYQ